MIFNGSLTADFCERKCRNSETNKKRTSECPCSCSIRGGSKSPASPAPCSQQQLPCLWGPPYVVLGPLGIAGPWTVPRQLEGRCESLGGCPQYSLWQQWPASFSRMGEGSVWAASCVHGRGEWNWVTALLGLVAVSVLLRGLQFCGLAFCIPRPPLPPPPVLSFACLLQRRLSFSGSAALLAPLSRILYSKRWCCSHLRWP